MYAVAIWGFNLLMVRKKQRGFPDAMFQAKMQCVSKGQLISKADWRAIDSSKKRTDEFVLFAFLLFTAKKSNSSVRFLEESTARQSAFRN